MSLVRPSIRAGPSTSAMAPAVKCDLTVPSSRQAKLPGGEVRKEIPIVDRKLTGHIKALQYQDGERGDAQQAR